MGGLRGAETLLANPVPRHRAPAAQKEAPCANAYEGTFQTCTGCPLLMIQSDLDPMGGTKRLRVSGSMFLVGFLETDSGIRIPMKVFY